jgi:hypothetical protein
MGIRRMIPMGTNMRLCIICKQPVTALDKRLTVHELKCLELFNENREQDK